MRDIALWSPEASSRLATATDTNNPMVGIAKRLDLYWENYVKDHPDWDKQVIEVEPTPTLDNLDKTIIQDACKAAVAEWRSKQSQHFKVTWEQMADKHGISMYHLRNYRRQKGLV